VGGGTIESSNVIMHAEGTVDTGPASQRQEKKAVILLKNTEDEALISERNLVRKGFLTSTLNLEGIDPIQM